MNKFKIGDVVRVIKNNSVDSGIHNGRIGKISGIYDGHWGSESKQRETCGNYWYYVDGKEIACWETDLEFVDETKSRLQNLGAYLEKENYIKSKKTLMKTVSNMMKKLLDADTQELVEANYINGDLELTIEGIRALQTILFVSNKAELVKMAVEANKESETK